MILHKESTPSQNKLQPLRWILELLEEQFMGLAF